MQSPCLNGLITRYVVSCQEIQRSITQKNWLDPHLFICTCGKNHNNIENNKDKKNNNKKDNKGG